MLPPISLSLSPLSKMMVSRYSGKPCVRSLQCMAVSQWSQYVRKTSRKTVVGPSNVRKGQTLSDKADVSIVESAGMQLC
jgi:hypothetical protein